MTVWTWSEFYSDENVGSVPVGDRRDDLLLERLFTADASGSAHTDYISSRDVLRVRVVAHFLDAGQSPSVTFEEAQLDSSSSPRTIRSKGLSVSSSPDRVYEEIDLTARAFKLIFSSMGDSKIVAVTIRKVG